MYWKSVAIGKTVVRFPVQISVSKLLRPKHLFHKNVSLCECCVYPKLALNLLDRFGSNLHKACILGQSKCTKSVYLDEAFKIKMHFILKRWLKLDPILVKLCPRLKPLPLVCWSRAIFLRPSLLRLRLGTVTVRGPSIDRFTQASTTGLLRNSRKRRSRNRGKRERQ